MRKTVKFYCAILVLFFGLSLINPAIAAVQWKIEDGGNGHWYKVVHIPEGITWTQAYAMAPTILPGGYLATITSAAENSFVWSNTAIGTDIDLWALDGADNYQGPWLGVFKQYSYSNPAMGWVWITGEPWQYTAWAQGEPNNYGGGEDRLQYFWQPDIQQDMVWNDVPNHDGVVSFVVESPIPEPATLILVSLGGIYLRLKGNVKYSLK